MGSITRDKIKGSTRLYAQAEYQQFPLFSSYDDTPTQIGEIMKQGTVEPFAYCATCHKPSWNRRDINYAQWKWKAYYCREHSPITEYKPRSKQEVQAEESFFDTHSITDIPF